jgi:hypothetical protein
MNSGNKNPKVLLDEIAEFMAMATEEMSDEELLQEAGDLGGTAAQLAGLKRKMEERVVKVRRERLAAARAKYEQTMTQRAARKLHARPPVSEIRKRIQQVFTRRGEMPLAVAWRNGEYQSDEDLLTLWDQLCELGAIKDDAR